MPRSKPHTVSGDAAQALELLVAAKAAGFELSTVTVGGCRIELREPPPAAQSRDDDQPQPRDPRDAIYQRYGGELYRRAMQGGAAGASPVAVPGADLQPAIGGSE